MEDENKPLETLCLLILPQTDVNKTKCTQVSFSGSLFSPVGTLKTSQSNAVSVGKECRSQVLSLCRDI